MLFSFMRDIKNGGKHSDLLREDGSFLIPTKLPGLVDWSRDQICVQFLQLWKSYKLSRQAR